MFSRAAIEALRALPFMPGEDCMVSPGRGGANLRAALWLWKAGGWGASRAAG